MGLLLLCGSYSCASTPGASDASDAVVRQEFQFDILNFKTERQYGRTLDVVIRYRYRRDLSSAEFPDYREIRKDTLEFIRVRPKEPADEYWEVLNADLVQHLYDSYPLSGITSLIRVHPDPNPKLEEPGWHSSIATTGDILPLSASCPR